MTPEEREELAALRRMAELEEKYGRAEPKTFMGMKVDPRGYEAMAPVGNAAAGLVRGAGSIGATLMWPIDKATDAIKGDREKNLSGLVTGQQPISRNEERRLAMDQALGTMGADHQSAAFGAGKLGSEVMGTAGVGGLLAKGAQALGAAPRVVEALRTAGMTTGAPAAKFLSAPGALDMLARTATGATVGGASALAVDPSSAGGGAAIGAATPGVLKAAGGLGHLAGSAVRPVAAAVSDKVAHSVALDKIRGAIGQPNITQAVGDIQTYFPNGAENIPVSASAIVPKLSQLEQGARLRNPQPWVDFDQRQAGAVWDAIKGATKEADEISKRFTERAENWAANWAKAENGIKPRVFAKQMGLLKGKLDEAARSKEAVNPDVMAALKQIDSTVAQFGDDFSPGHLQQLRAEFNGKVKPLAQGTIKSAPRDSPLIKDLITELDDILTKSTSGKWGKVRAGYAQDTTKAHAAKAAEKVRNAFQDQQSGLLRKAAADPTGNVPRATEAGLRSAIDSARLPGGNLALSDDAMQALEGVLGAVRRQGNVQAMKRSAGAGGGSDTMSNAVGLGASALFDSTIPLAGLAAREARKAGVTRTDRMLAELLQDPDALAKLLPEIQSRGLLSPQLLYRVAPLLATDR